MSIICGGSWQSAVGCIGTTLGWAGAVLALANITLATVTTGPFGIAAAILFFEADGVAVGISCGKWASGE